MCRLLALSLRASSSHPYHRRHVAGLAVALVLVIASGKAGAAVPFTHDRVDNFMQATSVGIDGAGRRHLAYVGSGGLRYAIRVDGVWTSQILDAAGTGPVSLKLDSGGTPHIAYLNAGRVTYATPTAGVWAFVTVDANAGASSPSLALGPAGEPRIAYIRSGLRLATRTGGVWGSVLVDATGGASASLAINAAGRARVSYVDPVNFFLRYADETGPSFFVLQTVVSGSIGPTSIAVDRAGQPRILYKNGVSEVRIAEPIPTATWVTELVESSAQTPGDNLSLAMDQDDHPHVAYTLFSFGTMNYATRPGDRGTPWVIQGLLPVTGSNSNGASIVLDGQGNPVVSFSTQRFGTEVVDSGVWLRGALGGADLLVGDNLTVEWRGGGPVTIGLSSNGGASYESLLDGVASSPITLPVPHAPTHFARLRIDRASPAATSFSESFFTIHVTVALLSMVAAQPPSGAPGAIVSWRTDPGPEHFAGFRLERSTSGAWSTVVPLTRETSYTDPSATLATRYRLFMINGLGEEMVLGEASFRPAASLAAWPLPYRAGNLAVAFATHGGLGGGSGPAEVSIFDASGRWVRTIARGDYPAGYQSAQWDGRDARGHEVATGVYFLRVSSAGEHRNLKLVVMR